MYKKLTEILKGVPKGTKLYSPMFGECEFRGINGNEINVVASDSKYGSMPFAFDEDGLYLKGGECLLFPSRENREWGTFKVEPQYRPFKNTDECWQEMLKHKPFGWLKRNMDGVHRLIDAILMSKVRLADYDKKSYYSFNAVFENFAFADGHPFGIKEDKQ